MRRLATTAAAGALLAAAGSGTLSATASAATVHYEGPQGGEVLVYAAAPGERNDLEIQSDPVEGAVRLYDSGVRVTAMPRQCFDDQDYGFVTCPAPNGVRVSLGDNDDGLAVSSPVTVRVDADGGDGSDRLETSQEDVPNSYVGGPGDDALRTGGGNDVLDGGEGDDTLEGHAGFDRLSAGPGDDLVRPDGSEGMFSDVVDGGTGVDRLQDDFGDRRFDAKPQPVTLTLGGGADDGRPGEGDDIRGVERVILTNPGGRVTGTDGDEYVKLQQVGSPYALTGLGGADELRAGDGEDELDGGPGNDRLDGGFGDDLITGGPGRDTIDADLAGGDCGPLWCKHPFGNDVVQARDGEADSVMCGAGTDRVIADASDVVAPDCEQVERPGKAPTPADGCESAEVRGLSVTRARARLVRAGCQLRTRIRYAAHQRVRRGRVIRASVSPRSLVLVVSRGRR
jgi:Ca2+-binding RTX toxin-like protein